MKNNNRIFILFISIALSFWNPLAFYFIYGDTYIFNNTKSKYIFWCVFFLGLIIISFIHKGKISNLLRNLILSCAITGILFSGLVLIDRGIGFFTPDNNDLIFEPNTKARYQTFEFDFIVKTNNFGLRNKDIEKNKKDKFRILCFGDSWTNGWGVNEEDSWPNKLEQYLSNNGITNIEVINCGQSGNYTANYNKHIERIVPYLQPDLVLVGTLQLDDLAQIIELTSIDNKTSTIKYIYSSIKFSLEQFLYASFHNSYILLKRNNDEIIEIKESWKTYALNTISNLTNSQKIKYSEFSDSLKILFESGNLNPFLLSSYINFPERNIVFNDPNNYSTKVAINEMIRDFEDMKYVCYRNSADLIFVNLPIADFTGHNVIRTQSISKNNKFVSANNNIDSIYKSIALIVNVPYFELTDKFIKLNDKSSYFFRYDGHPNENGYNEIGNSIGEFLISKFNIKTRINK